MDEKTNPIEEERFEENPNDVMNSKQGSKLSWGLYILIGGVIWAVFELVDSILYFVK